MGKGLRGLKWSPGDKVKLRVDGKSRSYTPSAVDRDAGWMDIIFFLHGNGTASRWAGAAEVGTPAVVSKPEKSIKRYKKKPDWALFLGDETTLGLCSALLTSLPTGTVVLGAIEVEPQDVNAISKLGLPLSAAVRQDHYGDALIDWLGLNTLPDGDGIVWISGESVTVRTLKRMLDARDLGKTVVKSKGYWKSKRRAVSTAPSHQRAAAK